MIAASIVLGLSFTAGTASGKAPKPDELTSEPPRGTYVRVPDARLVDPVGPQAGGAPPHILFIQRCAGGLELNNGPDDSINNTSTIPPGPATLPDYPFGNDSWQEVMAQTRDIFAPFNIDVTDEDPGTAPHDEAVVCGDGSEVGAGGAGGIAPFNCGIIPNAITFTFPGALGNNPRLIAEVIAQEAAHAWGLDHALLCEDPMTYLSGCGNKYYQDVDAECGEFEARPCDCGIPTQNSYRHILNAFGPAIPDVDGPVVLITAPLSGTTFAEGEGFNVIATITDDSLLTEANLYVNGQLVQADTSAPWGWQINNVPTGLFAIEVVATDEYENEGLSTPVSILVEGAAENDSEGDEGDPDGGSLDGGSGSDDGEETETAGQDDDAKGCGCAQGGTGAPWLASMPLVLLFGLRRRRAASQR
jgi:hypothetical protein